MTELVFGTFNDLSVQKLWPFVVPDPQLRRPLDPKLFVTEVLPLLLIYHVMALLVLVNHSLSLRLALLPVSMWLAWNAGTTIVVPDPRLNHLNYGGLMLLMFVTMRCIEWSSRIGPYRRKGCQNTPSRSTYQLLCDALNLCYNVRGIGWDWGHSCPTSLYPSITPYFAVDTFIRVVGWSFLFDVAHIGIQGLLSWRPRGSPGIFDPTLPLYLRYLESTAVTFMTTVCIHAGVTAVYNAFAIVGTVLFRQSREDWPAIFDNPWTALSLAEFWGKRWHQVFRRTFITVGGKPMEFLFGRLAGVFGIFFISGLIHDLPMWGMGQGTEFIPVSGYFLVQAVGIVLEGVICNMFGVALKGSWAKAWTALWLLLPANFLVDAWIRRGMADCMLIPDLIRPSSLFQQLFLNTAQSGTS